MIPPINLQPSQNDTTMTSASPNPSPIPPSSSTAQPSSAAIVATMESILSMLQRLETRLDLGYQRVTRAPSPPRRTGPTLRHAVVVAFSVLGPQQTPVHNATSHLSRDTSTAGSVPLATVGFRCILVAARVSSCGPRLTAIIDGTPRAGGVFMASHGSEILQQLFRLGPATSASSHLVIRSKPPYSHGPIRI